MEGRFNVTHDREHARNNRGVHFEKFSTAGWYLRPGTCLAQQTSWTTVSGQLPKQATCDWDPSSGFCSFRLCVFFSVTYYSAGFEPPPPSRSPRQSVFFPPSQCFCFRRWQTAPPVQFNTYYTLQITLSHTEAGGGGKKKRLMEGVRPIKMWQRRGGSRLNGIISLRFNSPLRSRGVVFPVTLTSFTSLTMLRSCLQGSNKQQRND